MPLRPAPAAVLAAARALQRQQNAQRAPRRRVLHNAAAPVRRGPPRAARRAAEEARQRNIAAKARLLSTINAFIEMANIMEYGAYRPTLNAFRNFAAENNSRRLGAKARAILRAYSRMPAGNQNEPGLTLAQKVALAKKAKTLLRNYSPAHAEAIENAAIRHYARVPVPQFLRNAILEGVARAVGPPRPRAAPAAQRQAPAARPVNARTAFRQAAGALMAATPAAAMQTGRAVAQRGRRAASSVGSVAGRTGRAVAQRGRRAAASVGSVARRMAQYGGPLLGGARQRANF